MRFDPQSNLVTAEADAVETTPQGVVRVTRTVPATLVLGVCALLIGGLMWLMVGPGVASSFAAGGFNLPEPVRFDFTPRVTPATEPLVVPERRPSPRRRAASAGVTRQVEPTEPAGSKLVSAGRAHYFRGRSYLDSGRMDDAVSELTEAVRLAPDHADAHYKLGLAYIGLRDHAGAQQELAMLEKLDPSLASLLGNLVQ